MNPVIVIPSYWSQKDVPDQVGGIGSYDHATPIDKPLPELETCLASLEQVRGVLRVIVLLVATPECQTAARARVDGVCRMHPRLNPLVIGAPEAKLICGIIDEIAPRMDVDAVSLRGYGPIRNMGLAVASVLGHDVVVFLDDDEVALDENFLLDAVYGMGLHTRQGLKILAKSGYFLDRDGSPYAKDLSGDPRSRHWDKGAKFNQWMTRMLDGTRIARSNYVCGGCFAVSARAFSRVGFDPAITRGEDLDYLLNLRLAGMDVWFDNAWCVRHLPPEIPSRAARFLHDVYRWEYEVAKLARASTMIGMRQVRPESLRPYPCDWISPQVSEKISKTALVRAVLGPERLEYLKIWLSARHRARAWAHEKAGSYFSFMTHWPGIVATLWDDVPLANRIMRMGTPAPVDGKVS